MRGFRLGKSVLFVATFCLIYGALELANFYLVGRYDNFSASLEHFAQTTEVKGLILGDSHAAYGVNPEYLPAGWFNLSYPSDNMVMTYLKLKYALSERPGIRFVIIPVDFHIFSAYRADGADYSKYYSLASVTEIYEIVGVADSLRSLLKRYFPLLSYYNRAQFVEYLFARLTKPNDHGGGTAPAKKTLITRYGHLRSPDGEYVSLSESERVTTAKERVKEQMKAPLVTPLMVRYFDEVLRLCRSSGIRLIGVRYPVSKEYYSLLPAEEFASVLAEFERRESDFAMVADYTRIYEEDPEVFLNADHLNASGSLAFTRVLDRALKMKGII